MTYKADYRKAVRTAEEVLERFCFFIGAALRTAPASQSLCHLSR